MFFFKKEKIIGNITLSFSNEENHSNTVFYSIDGDVSEDFFTIIWGQYLTYILNAIGKCEESENFIEVLYNWCSDHAVGSQLIGLPEEAFREIQYGNNLLSNTRSSWKSSGYPDIQIANSYKIEILTKGDSIPFIKPSISPREFDHKQAFSGIISLSRVFHMRGDFFAREFPVYILCLLKYFRTVSDYTDQNSIIDGAIDAAHETMKTMANQ